MPDIEELTIKLADAIHADCSWWRRDKWCGCINCKCQLAQTAKDQISVCGTGETND